MGRRSRNTKRQIDYDIRVPKTARLDWQNRFGDLVISETQGEAHIDLRFGSLGVEPMTRGDLRLRYSRASHIGKANRLKIDSDYSELELGSARALTLESRYSHYRIARADEIKGSCHAPTRIGEREWVLHIARAHTAAKIRTATCGPRCTMGAYN